MKFTAPAIFRIVDRADRGKTRGAARAFIQGRKGIGGAAEFDAGEQQYQQNRGDDCELDCRLRPRILFIAPS